MATKVEPKVEPKAQVLTLRAQLLEKGRADTPIAVLDSMWMHLKVYAEGGENAVHSHPKEDHAFIVMDGQATFYDHAGNETEVTKYQGVLLPRGVLYRFQSSGDTNLVMLRIGAGSNPFLHAQDSRLGPDGLPLPGDAKANDPSGMGGPVPIPGKFFGFGS